MGQPQSQAALQPNSRSPWLKGTRMVRDVWINSYYFHDNIKHGIFLRSLAPYEHMVLHTYFLTI